MVTILTPAASTAKSFRITVPPFTHDSSVNGPVPTGLAKNSAGVLPWRLSGTIETPAELLTAPQPDEAAAMDAAMRQTRSLPPWIWITGLVALVVVIVALAVKL